MSKPKSQKLEGKAAKVPKSKKDKGPKPELVVFAFRLKPEERDTIHRAAGPGKATQFVLAAALAAAKQVRTEK